MGKNVICYFSGTGNSLVAARGIAAVLGETELVFMKNDYRLEGRYERIGFVFPCYAGGIPKAVVKYTWNLALMPDSADYVFSVATCNDSGGNCLPMLQSELRKKGVALDYGGVVSTVGNYLLLYPVESSLLQQNLDLTLKAATKKQWKSLKLSRISRREVLRKGSYPSHCFTLWGICFSR